MTGHHDLLPYPEYRESGLPWLGQVPTHWEVRRNGRLFAERNETGFGDLPILEVSLKTGVRVRDFEDSKRKQVMADRNKYKRAAVGDIAYNMMRLWQGAVGTAPVDGLVSPAYVVARPFGEVDSRYYAYLFRTAAYMNEVNKYSRGIVADRNRLYWDEFKQMPSSFPPPAEQRSIVAFLDQHGQAVRRFIRNRRRLIEVLNEQKQAIVDRAVTRGLDPHTRLKSSGVDWLGDVPGHWEVRLLKLISTVALSGVDKHSKVGETPIQLCNYTDVYKRREISAEIDFMEATATASEIEAMRLRRGDVLITKDSETSNDIAVPALVTQDLDGVLCGYHLAMIRPNKELIQGEYLFRSFSCRTIGRQFNVAATGVTRYGLSKHAIKNALFLVPPLKEQTMICEHIASQLAPITQVTEKLKQEIDLIQVYRTRLISDVVMGRVDVRQQMAGPVAQKPQKTTANIHFRRSVFAAEIVHRLHEETTFGHVKCEKLIFLCEKRCGIDTGSTYHRQAAGPYDNRALRSIDSQLKKQEWYECRKAEKGYRYSPMRKAGGHTLYFTRYFGDVANAFGEIISTFRSATTQQCEIVATLYAAWEDLLKQGNDATDDQIVEQVLHHWHPSKRQIPEQKWRTAIGWMKRKGLVPTRG